MIDVILVALLAREGVPGVPMMRRCKLRKYLHAFILPHSGVLSTTREEYLLTIWPNVIYCPVQLGAITNEKCGRTELTCLQSANGSRACTWRWNGCRVT